LYDPRLSGFKRISYVDWYTLILIGLRPLPPGETASVTVLQFLESFESQRRSDQLRTIEASLDVLFQVHSPAAVIPHLLAHIENTFQESADVLRRGLALVASRNPNVATVLPMKVMAMLALAPPSQAGRVDVLSLVQGMASPEQRLKELACALYQARRVHDDSQRVPWVRIYLRIRIEYPALEKFMSQGCDEVAVGS